MVTTRNTISEQRTIMENDHVALLLALQIEMRRRNREEIQTLRQENE